MYEVHPDWFVSTLSLRSERIFETYHTKGENRIMSFKASALPLKLIYLWSIEDNALTSSIRIAYVFPELTGKKTYATSKVYVEMIKYIINYN